MPCTDVTELIRIALDSSDCLVEYSLSKQTCGGAVAGRGLFRDLVKHRSIDDILSVAAETVVGKTPADDLTTYLKLKHLFALQATVRAFTGAPPDGGSEFVEILTAEHTETATVVTARLRLELLTDKIRACGLCGDACRSTSE